MRILFYIITAIWLSGGVFALYNLRELSGTAGYLIFGTCTFCIAICALIETVRSRTKAG